jgi:hypothetical protein
MCVGRRICVCVPTCISRGCGNNNDTLLLVVPSMSFFSHKPHLFPLPVSEISGVSYRHGHDILLSLYRSLFLSTANAVILKRFHIGHHASGSQGSLVDYLGSAKPVVF